MCALFTEEKKAFFSGAGEKQQIIIGIISYGQREGFLVNSQLGIPVEERRFFIKRISVSQIRFEATESD